MKQVLAERLGIAPDAFGAREYGILHKILTTRTQLFGKILSGEVLANTDEEIETAFNGLLNSTVTELMTCLQQVDALNPPLAPHVADQVKKLIFDLEKFDNIDVGHIVQQVPLRVHTETLEQLLRGNGDKGAIQEALLGIHTRIAEIVQEMLADKAEIDPDDSNGLMAIATIIITPNKIAICSRYAPIAIPD